jgi:hypothetical protein
LPVLVEIGVAEGIEAGETIVFVSKERDLEHAGLRFTRRYGSVILVILTSANGWRWPLSLRTRFLGL